jgi:hypothetical protein
MPPRAPDVGTDAIPVVADVDARTLGADIAGKRPHRDRAARA